MRAGKKGKMVYMEKEGKGGGRRGNYKRHHVRHRADMQHWEQMAGKELHSIC